MISRRRRVAFPERRRPHDGERSVKRSHRELHHARRRSEHFYPEQKRQQRDPAAAPLAPHMTPAASRARISSGTLPPGGVHGTPATTSLAHGRDTPRERDRDARPRRSSLAAAARVPHADSMTCCFDDWSGDFARLLGAIRGAATARAQLDAITNSCAASLQYRGKLKARRTRECRPLRTGRDPLLLAGRRS